MCAGVGGCGKIGQCSHTSWTEREMEGGRVREKEGGKKGGREEKKEEGREGRREGQREGGREGRREGYLRELTTSS